MIFTDGEKTLKLQILGYEFPELSGKGSEYSFEANWLVLRGTYTNEDGETAIFTKGCVLTYELTALAAELKVLAAGLKNGFVSDFEEPVLFMEVARLCGEDVSPPKSSDLLTSTPLPWILLEQQKAPQHEQAELQGLLQEWEKKKSFPI